MSEERFFESIKSTMSDYRPEVPQSVYTGMRKKLWWSQFTMWNASRFNMWYVLILLGLGGAAYPLLQSQEEHQASTPITVQQENVASAIQATPLSNSESTTVGTNEVRSNTASINSRHQTSPSAQSINPEVVNPADGSQTTDTPSNGPVVETGAPNTEIGSDGSTLPNPATLPSPEVQVPEKKKDPRNRGLPVTVYNGDNKTKK